MAQRFTYRLVPSRTGERYSDGRVWGVYVREQTRPIATRIARDEDEVKAWWRDYGKILAPRYFAR